MADVLTSVVVMMLPPVLFVMLPEDHLLRAGGVLRHVDVRVPEVAVAPGRLVAGRVVRPVLEARRVALAVGAGRVVLLRQLSGQRVVVRQGRARRRVVLRRSVL